MVTQHSISTFNIFSFGILLLYSLVNPKSYWVVDSVCENVIGRLDRRGFREYVEIKVCCLCDTLWRFGNVSTDCFLGCVGTMSVHGLLI